MRVSIEQQVCGRYVIERFLYSECDVNLAGNVSHVQGNIVAGSSWMVILNVEFALGLYLPAPILLSVVEECLKKGIVRERTRHLEFLQQHINRQSRMI